MNTLDTSISVTGSMAGSVLDPGVPLTPLSLTLQEAVRRGLAFNLGRVAADQSTRLATAQRISARSGLLPQINGNFSENGAKVDIAAEGFSASTFGNSVGFAFPTTVGPYQYYDLHGSFQQDVLDATAIHNLRSARQLESAAQLSGRDAREQVVLAVAGSYLQLLATSALLDQQRSELQYAEASYQQAQGQVEAGTKAPIESMRSQVELSIEKQRLTSEQGDFEKQQNGLARLIGLPLGVEISLADNLPTSSAPAPKLEVAIQTAFKQRHDLMASEAQLRAAVEARKAASAERLPTVNVTGNYGVQGTRLDSATTVFQASGTLSVPIFQGGRIHADTEQADTTVAQRRAELSYQCRAVELDVRNALIDLRVATEQLAVAENSRRVALQTLLQEQDRFSAGVTDALQVVSAQQALATADRDSVNIRFAQGIARIAFAHALGEAEQDLPTLLKGSSVHE